MSIWYAGSSILIRFDEHCNDAVIPVIALLFLLYMGNNNVWVVFEIKRFEATESKIASPIPIGIMGVS